MPTCCQSRRRRQHVIPQPQPSSYGSISHGMLVECVGRELREFVGVHDVLQSTGCPGSFATRGIRTIRLEDLERIGARGDAGRIRAQATRTYSDAWDESGRRQLLRLLANAQRGLIAPERPRGWSLRRRSVTAR